MYKKKLRKITPQQQTSYAGPSNSRQNNLPNQINQTYQTSSAQNVGFSWGNQSSWPHLPNQQQNPTTQKTPQNKGLLTPPPGLTAIQNNFCEQKFIKYLNSSVSILEKLSQGVEHPELLLQMFNETLVHNGHDIVNLPISVLQASRLMYLNKNPNTVQQMNFNPNKNFHSSGILQHQNTQKQYHHPHQPSPAPIPRSRASDFFIPACTTSTSTNQTFTSSTSLNLTPSRSSTSLSLTPSRSSSPPLSSNPPPTKTKISPTIPNSASSTLSTSQAASLLLSIMHAPNPPPPTSLSATPLTSTQKLLPQPPNDPRSTSPTLSDVLSSVDLDTAPTSDSAILPIFPEGENNNNKSEESLSPVLKTKTYCRPQCSKE